MNSTPNRSHTLDTETTGLRTDEGHRIIEIGVVELINGMRSGRTYHAYLNPQRDVPADAVRVHGITGDMLADKPLFCDVVDDFLAFIGTDTLIIHNAQFDLEFVNAELAKVGRPALGNRIVDTMLLARRKFPMSPASLDALCRRYKIDLTDRTKHGALLDADLLAQVYLQLCGGPQATLGFADQNVQTAPASRGQRVPREAQPIPAADLARHLDFLNRLGLPQWSAAPEAGPKMQG